jgi:hypothetical protein
MTFRLYRHDDDSAPVLNGQIGSLTNLLDAVLVNGYGTKPAAGWTIAQTGTNKRGYQQGDGGNHPTGIILYMDDTAPGAGGAREVRVCGFETMTAITPVGTGQFPNASQSSIGTGFLSVRKSNTTDATARRWWIVADAWTLYLFVQTGDDTPPWEPGFGFVFGDFESFKTGDSYAQIIIGRLRENYTDGGNETLSSWSWGQSGYTVFSDIPGHYCSRHWNQITPSARAGKIADLRSGGYSQWTGSGGTPGNGEEGSAANGWSDNDRNYFPYPNPVDGALWLAPVYINQAGMRGYLRNFWVPQHQAPFSPGDTITASEGTLTGKSFVAVNSNYRRLDNTRTPTQFLLEY